MPKLKFKLDKKFLKYSKVFLYFWNSLNKKYGVFRFWMLVLKKWRSGSQEL